MFMGDGDDVTDVGDVEGADATQWFLSDVDRGSSRLCCEDCSGYAMRCR